MSNPPRRRKDLFSDIILFSTSGVACVICGFAILTHDYYYLPLIFAIVLIVLAKTLKPSTKSNLALFIVTSGIILYAVELVLINIPTNGNQIAAKNNQQSFDARSNFEVIQQLRREGVQAYPTTYPGFYLEKGLAAVKEEEILLPLGGIANRTLVFCNESGTYAIYKSDEHGFRNPPELYQADQVDIALLGDSFTQGACVGEAEDIGGWIRKTYPRTLNLGSSGNGPIRMLATLKEYLVPLRPKKVIWIYFENDLKDLKWEMSTWIVRYLEDNTSQDLINRQHDIDQALIDYIKDRELYHKLQHPILKFLRLERLLGKLKLLIKPPRKPVNAAPETIASFRNVLIKTKETVSQWGGRLYFVYLSGIKSVSEPAHQEPQRDLVLSIVDELKIPLIDTQQSFLKNENPISLFPFQRPNHYNAMGYKLVADTILQSISNSSAE